MTHNEQIIEAQKELIDFYEHMIRKTSPRNNWLDADIRKGEELRKNIISLKESKIFAL